jgi:hypothetical protein
MLVLQNAEIFVGYAAESFSMVCTKFHDDQFGH